MDQGIRHMMAPHFIYLILVSGLCLFKPTNVTAQARGSDPVLLWGIFEADFSRANDYEDPFRDVSLDVTYMAPDGTKTNFWGFYDGDTVWKARFMPNLVGAWHYEASFSDHEEVMSGSFEVVDSGLPGLITKDLSNPSWFGFAGGKHASIRGFHVGDRFFAANWPSDSREIFLDWVQKQGYNLLSVASFYLNREAEGRGAGWQTPDLWDSRSRQPRPEEFARAEAILDDLSSRGIVVYPFAGFFGQSSDFPLDPDVQEFYLRYTMARFGPYWNLLYNVAGPEPLWRPAAFRNRMNAGEIIRLGSLIQELDPFGHLVSIHNETGPDPFRHETWHDYVTLQGGKEGPSPSVHRFVERYTPGGKPVFAQEVFWPGNVWHECECTDAETIRKKAFLLLFAGSAINFADMDGNSSTGFSGTLDLDDRHQKWHDSVKEVWDWFDSIPFYRMSPVTNLATNGFALAEVGVRYAIYTLDARIPITINLAETNGTFGLRWYNPRTQRYHESGVRIHGGSLVELPPPPGELSHDWIALIDRDRPMAFVERDGKVVIEAEHAVALKDWVQVQGISGSAMRDEGARNVGYLDYPIVIDTAGDYYIYMLMRRTDEEHIDQSNDTFVSFGGRRLFASDGISRPDGIRCSMMEFTWESVPQGPGFETPGDILQDPVYIKVTAPGAYTLRISSRSPGFEVDKIVLLREPVAPAGSGPEETWLYTD